MRTHLLLGGCVLALLAGCSSVSVPKDARLVGYTAKGVTPTAPMAALNIPGTYYIYDETDHKLLSAFYSRTGAFNLTMPTQHAVSVYVVPDNAPATKPAP